jgi:spore maturation protein CgeB
MKILYFDPKATNIKNQMYSYYNGTYSEMLKQADIDIVRRPIRDIGEVLSEEHEAIVFGIGWFAQEDLRFFQKINNLDKVDKPVICNMHKVANQTKHKINFLQQIKANLILMSPGVVDNFSQKYNNMNFKLFPFAAHPSSFYDHGEQRIYDFGFSGAKHAVDKGGGIKKGFTLEKSLLRTKMTTLVENEMSDYKYFWNCSDTPNTLLPEAEYARLLSSSKMWLATESPALEISPRHFEVIMSKTLLVTNEIPKPYKNIFIDGITCVEFKNDLSDFKQKIDFYLNNEEERLKIVTNAYDIFVKEHTWESRAAEIINFAREYHEQ